MLGELLAAVVMDGPAGSLHAEFGEVRCPGRVVDVTVTNTGGADAFYELRADDRVLRTEFISVGMRLDNRVVLTADGVPVRVSVRDAQGAEVAAATRTADCASAAQSPEQSPAEGAGPQRPAEGATPDESPGAPGKEGGPGTPGKEAGPSDSGAPKGGAEDAPGKGGPSKADGAGPLSELPRTGAETGALGRTGAAALLTGGLLLWYGRLWPRRLPRPCAPASPRRS
ncbi:hypothetical protein LO762_19560 [Actinocorallia sp. API 0066]|uniref:hypothetical protein n=1 Tax=Actinocorallia sp. API 0066 TaxID=2896846 RepID=UPI001E61505D|nr:hypothetical protein [Actinocorallia sp. API 0066]MCD0451380.1 hypothetical protein [Actinocorallia sp. API 0066]